MPDIIPSFYPFPRQPQSNADLLQWARDMTQAVQNMARPIADRTNAMIQQGTLAQRPASEGSRRIYFATDTYETFYDLGSSWVPIGLALDPRHFGAKWDGVTDDTHALQLTYNAANGALAVYLPAGTAIITKPIVIVSGQKTYGRGDTISIIKKTASNTTPDASYTLTSPRGFNYPAGRLASDTMAQDAIFIVDHPTDAAAYYIGFYGVQLLYAGGGASAIGIYAPRAPYLTLQDVYIAGAGGSNVKYGIFTYWAWQAVLRRVQVVGATDTGFMWEADGSGMTNGTSMSFECCYTQSCATGYRIKKSFYFSLESCGCDGSSSAAYYIRDCGGFTLDGCGAEAMTGEILHFDSPNNETKGIVSGFKGLTLNGHGAGTHYGLYLDGTTGCEVAFHGCSFPSWTSPGGGIDFDYYFNKARIVFEGTNSSFGGGAPSITHDANSYIITIDNNGVTVAQQNGTSGVKQGLLSGALRVPFVAKNANYTATGIDCVITMDASGAARTITLPPASNSGQVLLVKKIDSSANAVTVQRQGSDLVEGFSSFNLPSQNSSAILAADGGTNWRRFGDIN